MWVEGDRMRASAGEMAFEALRCRGWLGDQPADFASTLVAHGRLRSLQHGDYLYREGDSPGGIYGIVSGGVGMLTIRRDGQESLAHIVRRGDWVGEGPMMGQMQRFLTLRATEPSQVLCVPLSAIRDMESADPGVAKRLGQIAERGVLRTVAVASDLLLPGAESRVAATLLRVTPVIEDDIPDPGGFRLTQSELGEMANASRNHVNRTLQRFRSAGWVSVRYNHITINDATALLDFICDSDT
jgi:CRP-like cAMP-binding protein